MVDIDILQLNPTSYSDLGVFALELLNWFIGIAALITVIAVIIAGFKFILSRGDDKKIQEATRALIFSVLGMVLVFLSPAIIKFVVDNFLG